MQALVSIIIPTYNRSHLIGETLDSVISQTYQLWECIVVDDGSTDYTGELMDFYCRKDNRISYIHRPQDRPKGANTCRNVGFELSLGKYIQWFDSDDVMHPEKVARQVEILEENQNVDLCLAEYSFHDESMNFICHLPNKTNNILVDYILEKAFLNFQTSIFTRSSIEGLKLDETLHKAQEVEFFLRFFSKPNRTYLTLHENLVQIRLHSENITSSFKSGNSQAIKSEMYIRLKGLHILKKIGSERDMQRGLQLYYKFLAIILNQNKLKLYFKYASKLFLIVPINYFRRVLQLMILGLVYIFIQRQPYRFRNIFFFKYSSN